MKKCLIIKLGLLIVLALFISASIMIEAGAPQIVAVASSKPSTTVSKLTLYVAYKTYQVKFSNLKKSASVSFVSNKTKTAKVNAAGIITPIAKGTALITVTIRQGGMKYTSKIEVTVKNPYIKFTSKINSLTVDDKYTFEAKAYGTKSDITWSVSNKARAKINSKTGELTALSKGEVDVIVTAGIISSSCTITISKVDFSCDTTDVVCYDYEQATVYITDQYEKDSIGYYIGDTDIATCKWGEWSGDVIPLVITPHKAGTTTITITSEVDPNVIVIYLTVVGDSNEDDTDGDEITSDLDYIVCFEGDVTTINFTDENYYDTIRYEIGDTNIVTCKWGEWNGFNIQLKVTAKSAGSTTITVSSDLAPNDIVISVSVLDGVSGNDPVGVALVADTTNVTCYLTSTVYITDGNSNDTIYGTIGDTNIITCQWGVWDGTKFPLYITGVSPGTTTITITSDKAPNTIVITVTVSSLFL